MPLANVFVDEKATTPLTHEFSTSFGRTFGGGQGYAEASYIFRRTGNMIEDFITIADGTTHVVFNGIDAGTVSNVVYRNTDEAWREYQADGAPVALPVLQPADASTATTRCS